MRTTVMMSSELAEAGTWSARDLMGGEHGGTSCRLCGLTPGAVATGERGQPLRSVPSPVSSLLTTVQPKTAWALERAEYECRNREGCERRRHALMLA